MTLLELRAAHPALFYRQEWYDVEPFVNVPAEPMTANFRLTEVRDQFQLLAGSATIKLVRAVDLAALYVTVPDDSRWRRFIWTDDIDRWGNRVYVGGVGMYGIPVFQVHRKLEPAAWWVQWS